MHTLYSGEKSENANSDIIVLSDEDSPTSPASLRPTAKVKQNNEVPINAHHSSDADDGSKVDVLRELLQQEEKKLTMLKQIRTLQEIPLLFWSCKALTALYWPLQHGQCMKQ